MRAADQSIDTATHTVTERQEDGEKDQQPLARAQTVWSFQNAIVRHRQRGRGFRSIAHRQSRLKYREQYDKPANSDAQLVAYDEVN